MWVQKTGYATLLLANEIDLNSPGSEIQLVSFKEGKHSHYHKKKTEYFYFLKGKGKVILDGKEIQINPGSSILVKPNVVHTFVVESSEPLEVLNVKTNSTPDDTFS